MMPGALSVFVVLLILAGLLPLGVATLWVAVVAWRRAVATSEIRREIRALRQEFTEMRADVRALREQQADLTLMVDDLPKLMADDTLRRRRGTT